MISATTSYVPENAFDQRWLSHTVGDIRVTGRLEAMAATVAVPFIAAWITAADMVYSAFGKGNPYDSDKDMEGTR